MDHFQYVDGQLCCESIPVSQIAEQFGTPLYIYSAKTLQEHFNRIRTAFSPLNATLCYSVKSCHNLSILRLIKECGASFDVVSGGELARVLEIGATPSSIVFAGVGKTDCEIQTALEVGIGWFNAESEAELENLSRIASKMNKKARAALRINPDVDPKTHVYTTTGKRETKFGVDLVRARKVIQKMSCLPGLELSALHLHLGSPVNTVEPYVLAIERALELIDDLHRDGIEVRTLNIGGGFGAHYDGSEAPPATEYASKIVPLLADKKLEVLLEPGRSIAANAGILVARTLYTKESGDRKFIIVDASITELVRPALYGSFHFAWPVRPDGDLTPPQRSANLHLDGTTLVDIVGPVCESGDFLAKSRWLPTMKRGDLVSVFSAGAYGFVMSSQYNSRPRCAEVLAEGGTTRVIRRRESYDDLVAAERL